MREDIKDVLNNVLYASWFHHKPWCDAEKYQKFEKTAYRKYSFANWKNYNKNYLDSIKEYDLSINSIDYRKNMIERWFLKETKLSEEFLELYDNWDKTEALEVYKKLLLKDTLSMYKKLIEKLQDEKLAERLDSKQMKETIYEVLDFDEKYWYSPKFGITEAEWYEEGERIPDNSYYFKETLSENPLEKKKEKLIKALNKIHYRETELNKDKKQE